jgi:uncharacterized heparinase superfamily protein
MASQWLKNLGHRTSSIRMLSPVYTASLGKPIEALELTGFPPDLFAGDAGRGQWVVNNQIDINGLRIMFHMKHNENIWFQGEGWQDTPFFNHLHQFDFLRDLKSLGGYEARHTARLITDNWMDDFERYHPATWSPEISAVRLVNWLIAYPFAYEAAQDDFIEQFQKLIFRHYYHLLNCLTDYQNISEDERFSILWAVLIAQSHCSDFYDAISFASHLQLLKGAIEEITDADGGTLDRSPSALLTFSQRLIQLKYSLKQVGQESPKWLHSALEKAVYILANLNHSDKDFPHFQGLVGVHKHAITQVIKLSGFRARRGNKCYENFGYTVIKNGKTSLIIDHGASSAHNAPLSFELAHGSSRIITSCGSHMTSPEWRESLSDSAAHSALVIENAVSKPLQKPAKATLENLNGAALFCGSHHGYETQTGVTHTRRFYLDKNGEDCRGEDLLTRNTALKYLPITLRFHLYPKVNASMLGDGQTILLKLQGGTGWQFHSDGQGTLSLEDSIICHDGHKIRKTSQIVMRVTMEDLSLQLKWALKKQTR